MEEECLATAPEAQFIGDHPYSADRRGQVVRAEPAAGHASLQRVVDAERVLAESVREVASVWCHPVTVAVQAFAPLTLSTPFHPSRE